MANEQNENNDRKQESVYSKRIKAGKRRTYFFDVRETRGSDFYLTITESRKRFDSDGYDRHKIFVYKEDFNKFIKALGESVDYVKTELMPDFDFDAFNHDENPDELNQNGASHNDEVVINETVTAVSEEKAVVEEKKVEIAPVVETTVEDVKATDNQEEVDKW